MSYMLRGRWRIVDRSSGRAVGAVATCPDSCLGRGANVVVNDLGVLLACLADCNDLGPFPAFLNENHGRMCCYACCQM